MATGWDRRATLTGSATCLRVHLKAVPVLHGPMVGNFSDAYAALDAAGARYLARGGAHKVYEGDWEPRRIVILEFPSVATWEAFYNGPTYQGLKAIRDECSSARLVSVEGIEP